LTGATTKFEIYLVRSGFSDELLKGDEVGVGAFCYTAPRVAR